jgi:type II secretory pathway pseudopilin PulG
MKTGKYRRVKRAFTLSEVMLAVGVVAFGLVAVFSILPFGLTAQKDNREETIIRYEAEYWFAVLKAGGKPIEELKRVDTIELKDTANTVYRINRYGWEPDPSPSAPYNPSQIDLARKVRDYWNKDVCGWLSAPDNRVTAKYARVWAFNGSLFDRLYSPRHAGGHYQSGGEFSFGYLMQSKVEPVGPSATRVTLKFWWPITGPVENALSPKSSENPDGGRSIDSIVNPDNPLYDPEKLSPPPNEKEFSILTNLQPRPALSYSNLNRRQKRVMRAGSPGDTVTLTDLDDMFPDRNSWEPWDGFDRRVWPADPADPKFPDPTTVKIMAWNPVSRRSEEYGEPWTEAAGVLQRMLSYPDDGVIDPDQDDEGWYLYVKHPLSYQSKFYGEITKVYNNDYAILEDLNGHNGRSPDLSVDPGGQRFTISFLEPGKTWKDLLRAFQGQGLGRLFVDPETGEDKWEFGSMYNSIHDSTYISLGGSKKYHELFTIIEKDGVVEPNPQTVPFSLILDPNDYYPFEAPSKFFDPPLDMPGRNRCSSWFFR